MNNKKKYIRKIDKKKDIEINFFALKSIICIFIFTTIILLNHYTSSTGDKVLEWVNTNINKTIPIENIESFYNEKIEFLIKN